MLHKIELNCIPTVILIHAKTAYVPRSLVHLPRCILYKPIYSSLAHGATTLCVRLLGL